MRSLLIEPGPCILVLANGHVVGIGPWDRHRPKAGRTLPRPRCGSRYVVDDACSGFAMSGRGGATNLEAFTHPAVSDAGNQAPHGRFPCHYATTTCMKALDRNSKPANNRTVL